MKKQIDVVGAVIVRDGLVLTAKRGLESTLPGLWEFPGGKIEPGERPQEALQRELREELLCEADIGAHIATTAYEYDFAIVHLACFYASLVEGEPTRTEHEAFRWLEPAMLGSLDWAPADIPAVEQIIADFAPDS